LNIFFSADGGGVRSFFIPSSPAASNVANTKYGFELGSGHLNSTLVPAPLEAGTLTRHVLLLPDHAI